MSNRARRRSLGGVTSRGTSSTRSYNGIIGALILASSVTTIVPALARGALDRTRSVAVLLVAVGWLVAWGVGAVRFDREKVWWLSGVGALAGALALSSLTARFPMSALLGGLGSGMGLVQWLSLAIIAVGASSAVLGRSTRGWIALAYLWVIPAAVVGVSQAFRGTPVSAGLLNDNLFGLVLVLWFAPAIGLAVTSATPWQRWSWSAVAALLAIAVFASNARAASVGLTLEAGLMLAIVGPVVARLVVCSCEGPGSPSQRWRDSPLWLPAWWEPPRARERFRSWGHHFRRGGTWAKERSGRSLRRPYSAPVPMGTSLQRNASYSPPSWP